MRPITCRACVLAAAVLMTSCSSEDESTPPEQPPVENGIDPVAFMDEQVHAFTSCALDCSVDCPEGGQRLDCPSMRPWQEVPHATESCEGWDGVTYPEPQQGLCAATEPTGPATAQTNSTGNPVVLPDGRRLFAPGQTWLFGEPGEGGMFPFSGLWIPGTRFVLISDDGYDDHALRVVDIDKLAAGTNPVVSQETFKYPASLNYGLSIAPDGTIYAASGRDESRVYGFTLDADTGALQRRPEKDVVFENDKLGDSFPMGIDVSPDGRHLIVAQVNDRDALVYSLEPATYGTKERGYDVGAKDSFAAIFDPFGGNVGYVSVWNQQRVMEIDHATGKTRPIETGRQPQEIVFLDANYIAVAAALSEEIAIIDRAAAKVVATTPIDPQAGKNALSPTTLAYDATNRRLYATLATLNGVAVFDVTASSGPGVAPVLKPAGRIPTLWWPTDVLVAGESEPNPGSLVIVSGKGVGGGPSFGPTGPGHGSIGSQMRGGIQYVPFPDAGSLATWSADFEQGQKVGQLAGNSTVSCPGGADYDFPVPLTNTEGPSKAIEHIIFIVRENKTYDAIMGDMPGADGDASLVMIPSKMEQAFGNIRKLGKTFSHSDNFYHSAEKSIQGHFWTVFGRTSDYTERTWLSTWGRATRGLPLQGLIPETQPTEGGIFHWLQANEIGFDNMGEQLGNIGLDPGYGTLGFVSTSSTRPDSIDACYIGGRARVLCNLKTFTYAWLVNDHTLGGQAGKPNPGLMIAVNDVATGMVVDALSHSPLWKSSLVVVIEDDPQDGADHVDTHRSIAVMASPWVKRGYVSHGHYDPASLHKLFSHLLGIPYNNEMVERAAVPFDMFTSTPDYTPYDYEPLTWTDLACNKAGTRSAVEAEAWSWDFTEPDDQPGLSDQLWRMLHEGEI